MNKHLIKLWILTLLLAPFVYAIINLIRQVEGQVVTLLEVLPITLIFSFVFSLPTLLLGLIVNKFIIKQHISSWIKKLSNILIAAIGISITLLIIEGSLMPTLIKTYTISLMLSAILMEIWEMFTEMNQKTKANISETKK